MKNRENVTPLIELRNFLWEEGVDSPPWSSEHSVVEALYDLLWRRRNDDRFWSSLPSLVADIEESQLNLASLSHSAGIPRSKAVESLLEDLRMGLISQKKERSTWKQFCFAAGTAGLLGFAVLGVASACTDTCDEEAEEQGIANPEVYCDLAHIINSADIPWTVRVNLMDCLPELDAAMRADYLDKFSAASDGELAQMLKELSFSSLCDVWEDDFSFGDDSGH